MRTYVKDTKTVTLEPHPGSVRVTLTDSSTDRASHVSSQYGNPRKLMRSIGADLRADGWTAA